MALKRSIGLFESVMYGVGLIVGAGIYVIIGHAAGLAGNALWLSFLIASFVAILTGLAYAELSTMFPKEAAEYHYVKNAFDKRLAFLVGWIIICTDIFAISTVALGFASYFSFFSPLSIPMVATCLVLFMALVNFSGIRQSTELNIILTGLSLLGLIIIICAAVPHFGSVNYFSMSNGLRGLFMSAGLVFFAYLGFEDIVNMAEETKNPKKTIPKAIILSVLITTVLYILVAISVVSLASPSSLAASEAPLALAVSKVFTNADTILAIIALCATASTVLVLSIVASRMIYGMASEGSLPRQLSKIHKKTKTPYLAILLNTIIVIIFLNSKSLSVLASMTDFGIMLMFAVINASLIWLRYKQPNRKRAFKVPLNIGKIPLPSLFGLLFCSVMLFSFPRNVINLTLTILAFGFLVSFWNE